MFRVRSCRGGLLVELLIALVVVGIGAAALVEAVRFAHGANLKAQYTENAMIVAQSLLDQQRSYKAFLFPGTYQQGGLAGLPGGTKATVTISAVSGKTGLWRVQVDIPWTAGGRRGSLSGQVHQETYIYAP